MHQLTLLTKKIPVFLLVAAFALCLLPRNTQAFTMSNAFYIIILGNLNSISGQATNPTSGTTLTFTSGELGAGLYTGTNYTLCAGFYGGIFCNKSSVTSGLFTFTVTPTDLDFGTIDPTSPVSRTNTLDVLSTASGYSVTAIENHSLQTASASAIPDTTCDDGQCTPSTATTWTNNLTYGFGYRCDNISGIDCVLFQTDFYRPFANTSLIQNPEVVMASGGSGSTLEKQAQITYKVNVSGSQIPGTYTNTITYVASPNF